MSVPVDFDIKQAIHAASEGKELPAEMATAAMNAIMSGVATPSQISALVTALRMKGETPEEIAGFARGMREHSVRVSLKEDARLLVDTCGTGGDGSGTFNISTTAGFVIAGAGVRVAKHGNRAATSRCGSADVLEGLGVQIHLTADQVSDCIDQTNFGFMFAQAFHPSFRHAGPVRREIGIRTIFNILGPLTNPAGVKHQLIGVGHPGIALKIARANAVLGAEHVVVVNSGDRLDEFGIAGDTMVTEYDARTGEIREYRFEPEEVGLKRAPLSAILGGDIVENVAILRGILSGDDGPKRDITLLNAGAGLYAANAVGSIKEGIELAAESIDSGHALVALDSVVAFSRQLAA